MAEIDKEIENVKAESTHQATDKDTRITNLENQLRNQNAETEAKIASYRLFTHKSQ